jgi:uncharacterized protein (UPF0332 family)
MTHYNSEDYINYRIERAVETILEVEKHIENKFWNTAINRMYYSCFYAVGALLAKNKIAVNSHTGARQKFGEHFVLTGKFDKNLAKHFTELSDKRNKGDYNDFFDFDEDVVLKLYPLSKEFVKKVEEMVKGKT